MEQNHIAPSASHEAATDEPAFSFATPEEADSFWKGVSHGIRCAGREPGHPHMPSDFSLDLTRDPAEPGLVSAKLVEAWPEEPGAPPPPPPRAARQDGWTPERQRVFLDALASTGVVADACRAAGKSREGAYALRRRAEGRAFALAWDAAILQSRRNIADDVMSRARHGVVDRVYRNGELVAERHRYDNRLTMAVLTRLDRLAEGMGEGAATARTIAGEWDQFLGIVEAGGEGADAFLDARKPPAPQSPEQEAAEGDAAVFELETEAALLARLGAYRKYQAGLPHEIRTADLDPAEMARWTEEQWARADFSGLLDRLEPHQWPEAVRSAGNDDADGKCAIRELYRARHGSEPDEEEKDDMNEEFEGCSVWEEEEGRWATNFPPPPGFEGSEKGEPGDEDYERELTETELAAIGADPESEAAARAERIAAAAAARDRFFGFAPPGAESAGPGNEGEVGAAPLGKSAAPTPALEGDAYTEAE